MKLIKINLNQTVSKAQLDQIKEEKKRWYIFGSLTSLFIIYLLWFSFMNYRMNNIIDSRQETIAKIINIKTLNKFENKRMFWAPKLIALSEITPEDMAITGLDFENKKLQISAISKMDRGEKDFDVVEDFMNRIDENDEFNKDFKSIKFDSMEKSRAKGQEVLSFTIKAKLK